jgi:hypothetical protein
MYISLSESCANGFRRWSDSQQLKYSKPCNSNEDKRLVMRGPNLALSGTKVLRQPRRMSLPTAENGLERELHAE